MKFIAAFLLIFAVQAQVLAQTGWSPDQQAVIKRMTELSATMRPGGGGGEAYAARLDRDFTRWTVGSRAVSNREDWIAGIAGWFDGGWRVIEGSNEVLEVNLHGNLATTRRIVRETFRSPNGDTQTYETGVVEVWKRSDEADPWMLFRASVTPRQVESN